MSKRRKPVRRIFFKWSKPFAEYEAEFFDDTRGRCALLGVAVPEIVNVRLTATTLTLVAKSPCGTFRSTTRQKLPIGFLDAFKARLKG